MRILLTALFIMPALWLVQKAEVYFEAESRARASEVGSLDSTPGVLNTAAAQEMADLRL